LETRTYNSAHEPLTITDAAGQTTTYTYNARGQVETVTNAKSETTTYAYHATNATLTSITGPVSGATTSFTYDAYGRLRTSTDADSYTVTMDYDALDRQTRVTYPDSTYEETTYRYLDPQGRRDRQGRWTRFTYDAARRLTATRDPLGRVVTQEWCGCGSLEALVDPNGNRTAWERDLQGRVTREVRANGSDTEYLYETTMSRLTKMTDAKNQETNYTYFKDDQLQQITYTNAVITTPSVSFTYDPIYGRMATMADGIGTTTYGYHAVTTPPAVGATRLASVDGPLTNDTIAYSYDQLGRITTRGINGVGVTWTFDALGRLTTEANVLGTFTYTYDGPTARLATVTYPNGQTSAYAYYPNAGDRRLQTIHHQYPNATTLSKFDYTYDATGSILTWRQQADATAVLWEYGYDAAEQLVAAVKKSTDPSPVVLKRYAYAYDPAGNRTAEQIDDAVTGASYNMMNQLVSQQPSGLLAFEGTVSEPASVTIAGATARVSAGNQFRGTVPIASGVNTVAVTATDPSGNIATNTYELTSAGTAKTFTYDANGNLTSDGTRTFEWDARNQLVAVNAGTLRSEFFYDGKQRRVRIVGKESGVVQSDARMLWCGAEICEERSADGSTVTRNVFKEGEVDTGVQRFFALDHLGSPQAVTGGTGVLVAHYRFDPWGHRSLDSGSDVTELGFTRYRFDGNAQVWLSQYRAYDSALGRWLSQDPIGRRGGGPNLYQYVSNQPVLQIDPLGLQGMLPSVWTGSGPLGCATAVALDVFKNHRRGPIDDRYSHCLASCWISQHCGGEDVAKLAEAGKELLDVIQCRLGRQASCDSAEQPTDYLDNMIGRSIANACGEVDCLGGCKSLQGAGPGPPGPYGR
jgi:RHS repeat-associated protein